ncbi:hypothetical protein NQ317_000634 [Molorchus minor]|uniref:SLC26A/SulP transporter domain-containing protein n=1 Tax=Molorchus minor TaxID=1323400 RepID=A0ABQ9JIN4_9CUCU|nr:hypothetical protein NQ317_000634 [Molorchus minor]
MKQLRCCWGTTPEDLLISRRFLKKRVPILSWAPKYTVGLLLQDLLAGFTVGLTEIPQGIAYALVAGLPAQYGLYSGFMACFVYFIFGSCKDLNIGPTAIMSLMVQPYVTAMGAAGAILLCFLSGCIIFVLGLLHLGFIVEFFSYPVTAGFTTAAALNIASSQIKSLFGITGKSNAFLEAWISVFEHIGEIRKWDTLLGFITILFLVVAKVLGKYGTLMFRPDWSRRRNILGVFIFMFSLARNAIAVIVGTVMAYIFYQNGYEPFKMTGNVEAGLPEFKLPPFSTTFNGTEFTFMDMMKQYAMGRTLDATQELITLGLCNIMDSFVQAMPVTGSFTRSAVNNASGVRTTAGGIVTGAMVLLALGFLTSTFQYIPKATLAAVIIVAMYYLCEFGAFLLLWRTKKTDLIPLTVTVLCCLLISLEYGILIGIATNVLFVLYSSARPKLDIERPSGDVYIVRLKTGLHFAAAEYVREMILKRCIVEKSTVSFSVLKEELEIRGQKILFVNFKKSVMDSCTGVNETLHHYFREHYSNIVDVPLGDRSEQYDTLFSLVVKTEETPSKCKQMVQRKLPVLRWLPSYKLSMIWQDALAGFTVSLTLVPQGIAYAIVAGLPPPNTDYTVGLWVASSIFY